MKKSILSLLLFCFVLTAFAQENWYPVKNAMAVRYGIADYYSPVLGDNLFDRGGLNDKTAEFTYYRNLTHFLNLGVPLKFSQVHLPTSENSMAGISRFTGSLDVIGQFQYFRTNHALNPYALVGIGAGMESKADDDHGINAWVPLGLGLNVKLVPGVYLTAQSEYRLGLTDNRTNLNHTVGFMFLLGNIGEAPPVDPIMDAGPMDTDKDGIADADDKCPEVAGKAAFDGCPDSDNDGLADVDDRCPEVYGTLKMNGCPDADRDGIADGDDKCPNEKGVAANNGCPEEIVDTDGDGVRDEDDECPTENGFVRFNGCPDRDGDAIRDMDDECPDLAGSPEFKGCPDTDKDGIHDKLDKCPGRAGTAENNGCPAMAQADKAVLDAAMKSVQFETGSSTLKVSSYTILDQIADIMMRYDNYRLAIGGHTDSVGGADNNMKLSTNRAKACFDYLARRGVSASNMSYNGYGETQPIADNKYKDGRETNRRVEFILIKK